MSKAAMRKKRPCRICRHWFTPNPRLKGRQMTCGKSQCKRQWHRKKCAEWNKKHPEYFRANYLQEKLDAIARPAVLHSKNRQPENVALTTPRGRLSKGLPFELIKEVIGTKQFVIIEYLIQILIRRFQKTYRAQLQMDTG